MTRKRFVKLLMAEGYSRNTANDCAKFRPFLGISYQRLYNLIHEPGRFLD